MEVFLEFSIARTEGTKIKSKIRQILSFFFNVLAKNVEG